MPTLADYLKYANLQMAAEALFDFKATEPNANLAPGKSLDTTAGPVPIQKEWLIDGNLHASKFTTAEAEKFADQWTVVEHKSNTTTGFSGTLFRNKDSGEYTLSFRSTEFLDDAARDNQATNVLEISEKGWAFGQISDMEGWYQSIKSKIDGPLSVTGYSLGGHLATAFNLLHPGAASEVVTFNGAGVGKIGDGSLATTQGQLLDMIHSFQALRQEGEASGLQRLLQSSEGRAAYLALKAALAETKGVPCRLDEPNKFNDTLLNLVSQVKPALPDDPGATSREADYQLLWQALARARQVFNYAHWAPTLGSGSNEGPPNPANIGDLYNAVGDTQKLAIAGESLDYQLAVLTTASQYQSQPLGLIDGAAAALGNPTRAPGWPLPNQWDLAGSETTTDPWYMVAYSQYRYGNDFKLFIEDQPFSRGNAVSETIKAMMAGRIQLLHNEYNKNDFGDTHSLVLIVDSLKVQNLLQTLSPEVTQTQIESIFRQASNLKAINGGGSQGKAEGDALENVVNALGRLLLGPEAWEALHGDPEGNTWARMDDASRGNGDEVVVYSGRESFYKRLQELTGSAIFGTLSGKLTLGPVNLAEVKEKARSDFASFASLYALAPFTITPQSGGSLEDIAPAEMTVRHYQATDGARYLELDFGSGDRVSVRDGALWRMADKSRLTAIQQVSNGNNWRQAA